MTSAWKVVVRAITSSAAASRPAEIAAALRRAAAGSGVTVHHRLVGSVPNWASLVFEAARLARRRARDRSPAEVIAWETADYLVGKARCLIVHEDERAAIASASQVRTLRDQPYAVRMAELVEILERIRP